jgi:hypothetical protein
LLALSFAKGYLLSGFPSAHGSSSCPFVNSTQGVAAGSLSIKQEMSVGVCHILLDEEDAFALRMIICLCSNHKIWHSVFEGCELLTTFGLSIVQK